jgi:hypothetical protein
MPENSVPTLKVSSNPLQTEVTGPSGPTITNQDLKVTPPSEEPKKKPILKIVIGILIVSFMLLVGGMLLIKSITQKSVLPSPTPSSNDLPEGEKSPTVNWTPYVNKTLAFQLKTPKDWKVEVSSEQPNLVWLKASDDSLVEIIATDSAGLNTSDYIEKVATESQTAWEGKPAKEFGTKIDSIVGDFQAIKVPVQYLAAGFATTSTYTKVDKTIFSFTVLPSASADPAQSKASADLALVLSTFKKWTPIDFSKWKLWTDPNGFTFYYPPNARVNHLNENTNIEVKSDSGNYILSFCKDCVKDTCTGTCNKEQDIKITIGDQKYSEKQISPNNEGNFTFRVVVPFPSAYIRNRLVILGNYPYENALEEINSILSTFKFTEKKAN